MNLEYKRLKSLTGKSEWGVQVNVLQDENSLLFSGVFLGSIDVVGVGVVSLGYVYACLGVLQNGGRSQRAIRLFFIWSMG